MPSGNMLDTRERLRNLLAALNLLKIIKLTSLDLSDGATHLIICLSDFSRPTGPAATSFKAAEQLAMFESFKPGFAGDFFAGGGIASPGVHDAVQTRVATLACPSDGIAARLSDEQFEWVRNVCRCDQLSGRSWRSPVGRIA